MLIRGIIILTRAEADVLVCSKLNKLPDLMHLTHQCKSDTNHSPDHESWMEDTLVLREGAAASARGPQISMLQVSQVLSWDSLKEALPHWL